MFKSVLIANRGEIACRIARTAKRLGMRTIAVYSDADRNAPHVQLCDEAHLIGPAPAAQSYLRIDKLIEVARASGAQCVHPGYGFLSENAEFAAACAQAGVVFVGPPPAAIRAMGLKDHAKAAMDKVGVPVVPGYHGERQDAKFLKEKAYEIGYPVLIKAVAGGGGKGMRRVDRHADFDAALEAAKREAASAFGDERVLVEKYVAAPRHIEMQVFADQHGHAIHLNERDCSLQRRHQKVIEEAPAPGMTAELRAIMGAAAVAAAKAVGYVGAGTIEFIVDGARGLRPDGFWFMEMNTRLQVEHPVTEAITGLDLVEWQFRIAAGERLALTQGAVPIDGHAVEARLYAEDPERGFLPSTGFLSVLRLPDGEGIRVDTGVEQGYSISPYYDPMIAKVIARGATRDQALNRLAAALERTMVVGPRTNAAFLHALCDAPGFRDGEFDTSFIERNLQALGATPQPVDHAAAALGARLLASPNATVLQEDDATPAPPSPWDAADGFQLSGQRSVALPFQVDGEPITARVDYSGGGEPTVSIEGAAADTNAFAIMDPSGDAVLVWRKGRQTRVARQDFGALDIEHLGAGGVVRAPMHGKVLAVLVDSGQAVHKGQRVAIIEAMKMEHTLTAPIDGTVGEIAAHKDAQIAEGAIVLRIEP